MSRICTDWWIVFVQPCGQRAACAEHHLRAEMPFLRHRGCMAGRRISIRWSVCANRLACCGFAEGWETKLFTPPACLARCHRLKLDASRDISGNESPHSQIAALLQFRVRSGPRPRSSSGIAACGTVHTLHCRTGAALWGPFARFDADRHG